jgi:hypothetical protein
MTLLSAEQIAAALAEQSKVGQAALDALDVTIANQNAQALADPPKVVSTGKQVLAVGQVTKHSNFLVVDPSKQS